MGREEFSAPEKSKKEKDREVIQQGLYTVLAAFVGSLIGSLSLGIESRLIIALVIVISLLLANRKWDLIYHMYN